MRCLAILYKEQEGKRVGEEEKGHQRHRGRESAPVLYIYSVVFSNTNQFLLNY